MFLAKGTKGRSNSPTRPEKPLKLNSLSQTLNQDVFTSYKLKTCLPSAAPGAGSPATSHGNAAAGDTCYPLPHTPPGTPGKDPSPQTKYIPPQSWGDNPQLKPWGWCHATAWDHTPFSTLLSSTYLPCHQRSPNYFKLLKEGAGQCDTPFPL